jgi:(p)ppGpp synthase/HD superfamily hydrolase
MLYEYIDAVEFAIRAHAGQTRKFGSKEPYVAHPIRVSKHVLQATEDLPEKHQFKLATAAVLHDVIEDTSVGGIEIHHYFGNDVMVLVESVTKNTSLPKADKEMEYLLRFKQSSMETVLIKLADRFDNLKSMETAPLDFKRKYILNTKQLLMALPDKLKNESHIVNLKGSILDLVKEYERGM